MTVFQVFPYVVCILVTIWLIGLVFLAIGCARGLFDHGFWAGVRGLFRRKK